MRVAFSPDGAFIASIADIRDPLVVIWDIETGESLHKLALDEGHLPFSIAFSPDSSTLAIGRIPGAVELWDVVTGERLNTLTGLSLEVASIAWSPDGEIIAASAARLLSSTAVRPNPSLAIAAWDVTSGELLYARENPSDRDEVFQIALSPDGKWLASGTESGEIHLWDFESGETVDTLDGHTDWVADLAWSPDGQMLASVSADNTVIVWDNPLDASD
jgi:WD40 repeat protein